eukprot:CAMPEP_0184860476 /NCGR_PEP_ID=MMETSP0580-20130426/5357_1 /TAXON_ID=1118495 /ORGANISM="Dactyliosolen fragilissimus" /LENGTH=571 /DNA_ID=CAMNT_0027357593 /DNA_START=39 /DNA_END=1754 /DNA_ORIENTATION=-
MTDQTVYAEALIMAMARAFYEDEVVCLIDVLIRDKFLRDDDMGPRLSLSARGGTRKTLEFLQSERLVKTESVDDLAEGGSQATTFWYIDYNHAVNVIRLRIYLLQKRLEEAEQRARSSSSYICPGYASKLCNGKYTEEEAQRVVDTENTGLFLCMECYEAHVNNPYPPSMDTYTLKLQDNSKDLKLAMENIRRVNVQLSAKSVGDKQLRPGIYDLLHRVRSNKNAGGPLTSNLPSENRAMNIGSKRLAGTGRTAGNKAKKMKKLMGGEEHEEGQGHSTSDNAAADAAIHKYNTHTTNNSLSSNNNTRNEDDLIFLKNAMGQQIAFEVEKGGGARANFLATSGHLGTKLLDAAATRVAVEPDIVTLLAYRHQLRREAQLRKDQQRRQRQKELGGGAALAASASESGTLSFLRDNIGRNKRLHTTTTTTTNRLLSSSQTSLDHHPNTTTTTATATTATNTNTTSIIDNHDTDNENHNDYNDDDYNDDDDDGELVWEVGDEIANMTQEERRATFQAYYKKEMARQTTLLLNSTNNHNHGNNSKTYGNHPHMNHHQTSVEITDTDDDGTFMWEDA